MPSFTTTDGTRLDYLDAGEGPAVVLTAGFCAPAMSWALTVNALVDAGYRAISFDRRGHGTSESTARGQRMSRHGADLHELLVHVGLDDAVLVGGSMGASTSWACADLFGTAGLRGILTVDQTPAMLNTPDWPYGFYGYTPENAGTLFAAGVPDTGRGRRIDESAAGVAKLVARLGGMPAFADPTAMLPLLRDHALADWRDVIDGLDIPFVLVAGRNSQLWPCEHAENAVARNPLGRAIVIEDAGHAVNFDQPEAFNRVLLEFLGELPRP